MTNNLKSLILCSGSAIRNCSLITKKQILVEYKSVCTYTPRRRYAVSHGSAKRYAVESIVIVQFFKYTYRQHSSICSFVVTGKLNAWAGQNEIKEAPAYKTHIHLFKLCFQMIAFAYSPTNGCYRCPRETVSVNGLLFLILMCRRLVNFREKTKRIEHWHFTCCLEAFWCF